MKRALVLVMAAMMVLPVGASATTDDGWCRLFLVSYDTFMGDDLDDDVLAALEAVPDDRVESCILALELISGAGIDYPAQVGNAPGDGSFGPGIYIVGADIEPGTYRSTPVTGACLWRRLSGFGGSMDEVIEQDLVSAGQVIATIKASDKGFDADDDCGTWMKVD